MIGGRDTVPCAARAHRALVRNGAGTGRNIHVVVDHEIVVRILVSLVESLRDGDDIDVFRAAESLNDGPGLVRCGRRVLVIDERRAVASAAGRDAHHRAHRSHALVRELNPPVDVDPRLKSLRGTNPELRVFGTLPT